MLSSPHNTKKATLNTCRASDIGLAGNNMYVWAACVECGGERWVLLLRGKPKYELCNACSRKRRGQEHTSTDSKIWRGGRRDERRGYVLVYVEDDDPLACMRMAGRQYVYEHRLIVAKHIGRPLKSHEIVHHINRMKDDNRIENLEMMDRHEHAGIHKWRRFR